MIGQALYVAITLVSVTVLSRLLSPTDFGLMAMAGVLLSLGEQLRDFGITTSALRAKLLSHSQASNLFWVSLGLSLFSAVALCVLAPLVASFYGEPQLVLVVQLLSLPILLNGIQAPFQVQLARSHRYGALGYINVVANCAGVAVAIFAALGGWGYWALLAQSAVFSGVGLLCRVLAAKWRPDGFRKGVGTKVLLLDGGNYAASSFVNYVSRNADVFVLGVRSTAADVGEYSRANQFVSLVNSFVSSLTGVSVPVLNAELRKGGDITRSAVRIQSLVGVALGLIFVGLAVAADSFIPVALGLGWGESVPLLKVLSLGGLAYGLFYVNHWIFLVLLPSREMLFYSGVGQVAAVGLIGLGSLLGPIGTALGVSAGQLALWGIGFFWLGKCTELRWVVLLLNGLRIILAAGLAFLAASVWVALMPHGAGIIAVVVEVGCAALLFVIFLAGTRQGRSEIRFGVGAARRALMNALRSQGR